jgi:sulfur-carrier protein
MSEDLNTMPATKTVQIDYYAVFRDTRGCAGEKIETQAATAMDLYGELQTAHGFPWPTEALRVAVNDEFCPWSAQLREGDRVVFIAPVAGG